MSAAARGNLSTEAKQNNLPPAAFPSSSLSDLASSSFPNLLQSPLLLSSPAQNLFINRNLPQFVAGSMHLPRPTTPLLQGPSSTNHQSLGGGTLGVIRTNISAGHLPNALNNKDARLDASASSSGLSYHHTTTGQSFNSGPSTSVDRLQAGGPSTNQAFCFSPAAPVITQLQRLKVEDALTYLDQVKIRFERQPLVYNDFLDIMKDFKCQTIDTPGVIHRVSRLFRGHPQLILGFNSFLPTGFVVELADDTMDRVRMSTPDGHVHMLSLTDDGDSRSQVVQGPSSSGLSNGLASASHQMPGTSGGTHSGVAASFQSSVAGGVAQRPPVSLSVLFGTPSQPPMEFNHAITYVNKIKLRFVTQPDVYREFLEILHTYQKEQRMKTVQALPAGHKPLSEVEVYQEVAKLFKDEQDLLEEFSQFLPDAAASYMPSTSSKPAASDAGTSGQQHNLAAPQASGASLPQVVSMPPGGHHYAATMASTTAILNSSVISTPQSITLGKAPASVSQLNQQPLQSAPKGIRTSVIPSQLNSNANLPPPIITLDGSSPAKLPPPHPPPSSAGGTIKMESTEMAASLGSPSERPAYHQAAPRTPSINLSPPSDSISPLSEPSVGCMSPVSAVVASQQKSAAEKAAAKAAGEKGKKRLASPLGGKDKQDSDTPVIKKSKRATAVADDVADFDESAKVGTVNDFHFFDRVRKALRCSETYDNFLRLIQLYNKEIIPRSELISSSNLFLGKFPELQRGLEEYLGCAGASFVEPIPTKVVAQERISSDLAMEIDYATCRLNGASYRALPVTYIRPVCSGRTSLCNEISHSMLLSNYTYTAVTCIHSSLQYAVLLVLNDTWVSFPSWSSEDSTVVSAKKSQYDEFICRAEDERFELDIVIEINSATIQGLEAVERRMSRMAPEERARFRLDEKLGGRSEAVHQRAIRRIYGDKAQDIMEGLQRNPILAIPLVLRRLKAKDEEWRDAQKALNRIWREQNEKFYLKSLDHQGLTFKQNDLKQIRSKALLNQIETLYDERHELPEEEMPTGPHLSIMYPPGREVFQDATDLLIHHVKRQTGMQLQEKQQIKRLLRHILPDVFHMEREYLSDAEDEDEEETNDASSTRSGEQSAGGSSTPDDLAGSASPAYHGNNNSSNNGNGNSARQSARLKAKQSEGSQKKKKPKMAAPTATPNSSGELPSTSNKANGNDRRRSANFGETSASAGISQEGLVDCGYTLSFLPNAWYVFLRLHCLLCERLVKFRELAAQSQSEADEMDLRKRNKSAAESLKLRQQGGTAASKFYATLLSQVKNLLDGQIDSNQYEDCLRDMFTIHAYTGFTLDKIVQTMVRQLQIMVADENCIDALHLFEKHAAMGGAGGFVNPTVSRAPLEEAYQKAAEELMTDHNCFKCYFHIVENKVTFELLDTDSCGDAREDEEDAEEGDLEEEPMEGLEEQAPSDLTATITETIELASGNEATEESTGGAEAENVDVAMATTKSSALRTQKVPRKLEGVKRWEAYVENYASCSSASDADKTAEHFLNLKKPLFLSRNKRPSQCDTQSPAVSNGTLAELKSKAGGADVPATKEPPNGRRGSATEKAGAKPLSRTSTKIKLKLKSPLVLPSSTNNKKAPALEPPVAMEIDNPVASTSSLQESSAESSSAESRGGGVNDVSLGPISEAACSKEAEASEKLPVENGQPTQESTPKPGILYYDNTEASFLPCDYRLKFTSNTGSCVYRRGGLLKAKKNHRKLTERQHQRFSNWHQRWVLANVSMDQARICFDWFMGRASAAAIALLSAGGEPCTTGPTGPSIDQISSIGANLNSPATFASSPSSASSCVMLRVYANRDHSKAPYFQYSRFLVDRGERIPGGHPLAIFDGLNSSSSASSRTNLASSAVKKFSSAIPLSNAQLSEPTPERPKSNI